VTMGTVSSMLSHQADKAIREIMVLISRALVDEVVTIPYTEWEFQQLRSRARSTNVMKFVHYILAEVNAGRVKFKE
jgi:hypothetical protein